MESLNKKWAEPQLQVLVRGKPEEDVLGSCKQHPLSGPADVYWKCAWDCVPTACEAMVVS